MQRLLVAIAILLMIGVPLSAQQSNLLVNESFERSGYTVVSVDENDGTVFSAPEGWSGGVIRGGSETWQNIQPTGYPHTGPFKLSGGRSFSMARGYATFTAYIYQRVSVQPGSAVRGGAQAFIENRIESGSAVRAGIDPNGGTDPFSPSVVWSAYSGNANAWNNVGVETTAAGGTVTLFLYATQNTPNDPNAVYWDNAYLNGIAGSGVLDAPATPAPVTVRVAKPNLRVNVRSGAGLNFERIGLANPDETYAIIDELEGWVEIDFNGSTGYVSADYVTIQDGQPTTDTGEGASAVAPVDALDFTAQYALRLRAEPNSASADLGTIPYTTIVKAVGRTADSTWVQVIYAGTTGWVAARYGDLSGDIASLPVK